MKSLLKQEDLRILDFSHCGISNRGAVALSKFCLQNSVTSLILRNNQIGDVGANALCYAICKNCALSVLDLKLNPISQKGADALMKSLALGARNIKKLFLNGCGIKNSFLIGEMIEHNSTLECLDISNNALGKVSWIFQLCFCFFRKLDIRVTKTFVNYNFLRLKCNLYL